MAIIDKYISDRTSGWKEKALQRQENEKWLEKSAAIALKVLRELRMKSLSQKELAEKMNVSAQYINKLVKGRENLSLDTICKLEEALDITLFSVPQCTVSLSVSLAPKQETFRSLPFDLKRTYSEQADWSKETWVKTDDHLKHPA